jgi:AraC-like DNA-binding protein
VIATERAKFDVLRTTLRDVLMLASHSPDILAQPNVIESIEESILQAVDLAMAAASPASEAKRLSLSHYLALVRKFDEFVAGNSGKTLYSADVARQLGVSVRTLHNAVVAIRGMSMHRYIAAAAVERASTIAAGCVAAIDQGRRARERLLAHGRVHRVISRSVRRNAAADIVRGPQAFELPVVTHP